MRTKRSKINQIIKWYIRVLDEKKLDRMLRKELMKRYERIEQLQNEADFIDELLLRLIRLDESQTKKEKIILLVS